MQSNNNSHHNSNHKGQPNSNLVPLENGKTENRSLDRHRVSSDLNKPDSFPDFSSPYPLRLWDGYALQIQETGRTDDPDLLHHLQQVFEVVRASEGDILLPETVIAIEKQLQSDLDGIGHCQQILDILDIAESEAFGGHCPKLDEPIEVIVSGIEGILAIADRHLDNCEGQRRSQSKGTPSSKESRPRAKDLDTVCKHCNDLRYIREYLIERARSGIIDRELRRPEGINNRYRRLQKYLQLLPPLSAQVVFFIEDALERKVAGAKFLRQSDLDRDKS
ncbi:MAG: hypothetical protein SWY16_24645 [Cyanobacteriota bacterium]|nr:hypothetical protein [Cyanobacteriota bacterium]